MFKRIFNSCIFLKGGAKLYIGRLLLLFIILFSICFWVYLYYESKPPKIDISTIC